MIVNNSNKANIPGGITPRQLSLFKQIAVYPHDNTRRIETPAIIPGPGEVKQVRTIYGQVGELDYLDHLNGNKTIGLYAQNGGDIDRIYYDFDEGQRQFTYERQRHKEITGHDFTLIFQKVNGQKYYGFDLLTTTRPAGFISDYKKSLRTTATDKIGERVEVFPTNNAVFMLFRWDYNLLDPFTLEPVSPGDKGREIEIAYNWIEEGGATRQDPATIERFISEYRDSIIKGDQVRREVRREVRQAVTIESTRENSLITDWRGFFEVYRNGLKAHSTRNEFLFWFVRYSIQQGKTPGRTIYDWLEWINANHNGFSKDFKDIDQNRGECISWYNTLKREYKGGRVSLDAVILDRHEKAELLSVADSLGTPTAYGRKDKLIRLLTLLYSKAVLDGSVLLDLSKGWFIKFGYYRNPKKYDPVKELLEAGFLVKSSSFKIGVNGYGSKPITYRLVFVEKSKILTDLVNPVY